MITSFRRSTTPRSAPPSRRSLWRRSRGRRIAAALVAAAAAWLIVGRLAPAPPEQAQEAVASRALVSGTVLTADAVERVWLPRSALRGQLPPPDELLGARLSSAIGAGEVLTRSRLVPTRAPDGLPPGTTPTHVRAADPAALALIHPGESVRLFPLGADAPLEGTCLVLSVDPPEAQPEPTGASTQGAVLALHPAQVEALLAGPPGDSGNPPPLLTAYLVGAVP